MRQDLFEASLFEHHEKYHSDINQLEDQDDGGEDTDEEVNNSLFSHENNGCGGETLIEGQ